MKFSSLAAPKVVILTTFGAASDEDFIKMKTFSFQCNSVKQDGNQIIGNVLLRNILNENIFSSTDAQLGQHNVLSAPLATQINDAKKHRQYEGNIFRLKQQSQ